MRPLAPFYLKKMRIHRVIRQVLRKSWRLYWHWKIAVWMRLYIFRQQRYTKMKVALPILPEIWMRKWRWNSVCTRSCWNRQMNVPTLWQSMWVVVTIRNLSIWWMQKQQNLAAPIRILTTVTVCRIRIMWSAPAIWHWFPEKRSKTVCSVKSWEPCVMKSRRQTNMRIQLRWTIIIRWSAHTKVVKICMNTV